jgi:hypothetical protein
MPVTIPDSAGPHLREIAPNARWVRDGNYTLSNSWSKEMEDVLRFFDEQKQFKRRLPRLLGKWRELTAELAEGRTGLFLQSHGFHILSWEPASTAGYPGDLLVQWESLTPIFVEVKGPDWEGEFEGHLEKEEFIKRKALGKYVDGEGGASSPVEIPFRVIRDNALKKFAGDRPNMVVVVDDLMCSPADARGVIDGQVREFLREPASARVGAILFLRPECPVGGPVRYVSNFYDNPAASVSCQLPKAAVTILTDRAEQDAAMIDTESSAWSDDWDGALQDLAKKLCVGA